MNIGYIGLGALGGELARRFAKDHRLCVWDRSPEARARFLSEGIEVAETAAELGQRCDVVLTCLPTSADVHQALFGAGGLAEGLRPGAMVIDQTSGIPDETIEIAKKLASLGVDMVDAAVSASPHIVAQGGTTLMVAGPAAILERAIPVLQSITTTVLICGERIGDGQAMKLVNNAINGAIRMGTLELVALGRKMGLSLKDLSMALNEGQAHNQTTDKMLPALLVGKTSTNFALALMLKDLNQALGLGMRVGVPMPIAAATRGLLQIGLARVGKDARLEDMVGVIEDMALTRIAGTPPQAEPADAHAALTLIDSCIAELCRAVTLECVAAGLKYGLNIQVMRDMLYRTSGWSAAGRLLLAELAGGQASPRPSLSKLVGDLQTGAIQAAVCGAPVVLLAAVRSVTEAGMARYGQNADGRKLIELCEKSSEVHFGIST